METRNKKIAGKSLAAFFGIVILLSAAIEVLIICGGPEWLYIVLMWIPAIAANTAGCISLREQRGSFSLKRLLTSIGIRRCRPIYILIGCLLPLAYLLLPCMIYWAIYPKNFAYYSVSLPIILRDLLPVLVLGTFASILSALGEEIGWRGFMVPALHKRFGLNKTLVISGLVWCLWHLPLLISGDYMSGTPLWYRLPAFVLSIFPVGVMTGLLTLESGSIWPAAFLHATHNNYDQAVFSVITRGANKMYFVSETGVLTILCAWTLATILYGRARKRINQL